MHKNKFLNANDLFWDLFIAAKIAFSVSGSNPAPDSLDRMNNALVALEEEMVTKGVWRMECVHRDDLKSISKLLKQGIKRNEKRLARLEDECDGI
jgi:hypothetical protein